MKCMKWTRPLGKMYVKSQKLLFKNSLNVKKSLFWKVFDNQEQDQCYILWGIALCLHETCIDGGFLGYWSDIVEYRCMEKSEFLIFLKQFSLNSVPNIILTHFLWRQKILNTYEECPHNGIVYVCPKQTMICILTVPSDTLFLRFMKINKYLERLEQIWLTWFSKVSLLSKCPPRNLTSPRELCRVSLTKKRWLKTEVI